MSDVRHATTEELLGHRDGEGSAWVRAHLEECGACTAELYRLEQVRARLRALPSLMPPRDRFPVIVAAVRGRRRARWVFSAAGLAAAAVLTLIAYTALRPRAVDGTAARQAALERAMARSQALEDALRALNPERRALDGQAAQVVAELRGRIEQLDMELSTPGMWSTQPGRMVELWRERAGLMSALVDVHSTRVAAATF